MVQDENDKVIIACSKSSRAIAKEEAEAEETLAVGAGKRLTDLI